MLKGIKYHLKSLLKRPFKIGIITPQYPEKGSTSNKGVAIHTYYLTRELAKLGAEVHIFTSGNKNSKRNEYIGEGKRIIHTMNTQIEFPVKDFMIEKKFSIIIFDNKVIEAVMKENAKEKFNIIHSHITMTGALMSKYFKNLEWIHTFHLLEKNRLKFMSVEEKKYFGVERWRESTLSYADGLITVSRKLREEMLKDYNVKEKKVFYIPNGVDVKTFYPMGLPEERKVTYVGRFSPEKGIDIVTKIAARVLEKDKKAKFVIVAAPYKIMPLVMEKVRKELTDLEEKYPDRFIWQKEPLTREELAVLYNESMVYVQPSRYESFGMTVLEAMACGKAVITSNRGGLPEVVENAGICLSINTKLFAKSIITLFDDYRLRERFARRGLDRAQQFKWEDIGKQTFDLYKIIAKKTPDEEKPHEKVHEGLQNLDELHKNEGEKNEDTVQ
jgi:starch synthase